MNPLAEIQARFRAVLAGMASVSPTSSTSTEQSSAARLDELLTMIRPSQDAKFGDYQANFAMPLGKQLGRAARDVATDIVAKLEIDDLCQTPEIAGPGFINLRLRDDWLAGRLLRALTDERLAIEPVSRLRTYVVDYSAPNVAKEMHVGHIRSTVIGAAIANTLRLLGHRVVTDNHIGDWGTQFGMIIYGYKHFRDEAAYRARPVEELGRLYRLVRQIMDYHESRESLPELRRQLDQQRLQVAAIASRPVDATPAAAKEVAKELRRAESQLKEREAELIELADRVARFEQDSATCERARQHAHIGKAVLEETAKLHAGDVENVRLWREFLPECLKEISAVYQRLGVSFDHTLGESFYHDRLAIVVDELAQRGIAQESQGAIGVFLPGHDAPFLIRKQDGAFLYGTTDLATIQYRMRQWRPDAILYVVDHRQSLHFEQLFATARRWGYDQVELAHVSFGAVLGNDGRPFKTRAGDTVGLVGLLDEAVSRAMAVLESADESKATSALPETTRRQIAETVGIGAIKYADLSQNRTSDYVFSYDKMLAMNGNTATYMQYAYARVVSIFARGGINPAELRRNDREINLAHPAERALGFAILQFGEALESVLVDYRPNQLTAYLYQLANRYSTFFENCPVLKAEGDESRLSRLKLCDLTARTIRMGLEVLGIQVVERM